MSNTTIKYHHVKKIISDTLWNPLAKYLLNPNSKYGGFALSFHEKIDSALNDSDKSRIKDLVTTAPSFPEINRIKSLETREKIRSEISQLAKAPYSITVNIKTEGNIDVLETFSRVDACFRKESWAKQEFPLEFEFASSL